MSDVMGVTIPVMIIVAVCIVLLIIAFNEGD